MRQPRFDDETARAILRADEVDRLPVPAIARAARADGRTIRAFLDTRCREQHSSPDDIIRPCILRQGHDGFHYAGIK